MTKFEWDRELRGMLKSVPRQEVDKILQYYTELFSDKYEEGKTEAQIVREFGSPSDIAGKVLADYSASDELDSSRRRKSYTPSGQEQQYNGSYTPPRQEQQYNGSYAPPRQEQQYNGNNQTPPNQSQPSGNYYKPMRRGLSTTAIVLIIVFSPFIIALAATILGLSIAIWGGSISLIVAAFAMPIVGVANLLLTLTSFAEIGFLANLGASIAVIGVGFVAIVATISLFKLVIKLTKWMFLLIAKMFGYRGDRKYA